MGVLDGQAVSAAVTNPAFINKNNDDQMPNRLGLTNPYSLSIADIQAATNKLYTATGASESQPGTNYNATANTITNGQNYQTALSILAGEFDPASGHTHSGAAGEGPVLQTSAVSNSPVPPQPVAAASALGSSGSFAWSNHQHAGVHSMAAGGQAEILGDIILQAGSGIGLTQTGQNILISASGSVSGVSSIAPSGGSAITGAVVVEAGTGIAVTGSGQNILISAAPKAPTIQKFTSASGTYTTPSGVLYVRVRMVGGGGGGGGGAVGNGAGGSSGTSSTFGTSLLTASFGTGGGSGNGSPLGGTGGSPTVNSPAIALVSVAGGNGTSGTNASASAVPGSVGGCNPLGGFGAGGGGGNNGSNGVANTGAGGGGGGGTGSGSYPGAGGGAGAYIEAIITSPLSTYAYLVGAGGVGGSSTDNGGSGGSGYIEVTEYYQ